MNNSRRQYLVERPKNFKHALNILYTQGAEATTSATFYKDGTEACRKRKYRSLNQVYNILKGYFPRLKLKTVVNYLQAPDNQFGILGCPKLEDLTVSGKISFIHPSYTNRHFEQYKHKYEEVFS